MEPFVWSMGQWSTGILLYQLPCCIVSCLDTILSCCIGNCPQLIRQLNLCLNLVCIEFARGVINAMLH